jgi:putative oxidoreductase
LCPQWGRFWLPPMKFLQLNFIPRSADLGLLVLRLWIGASMAVLHGWGKLAGFSKMSPQFLDFMGIGKGPSLALTVFAELAGAAFIVVGLWTRLSALVLAFAMGVAFWVAHGGKLTGQGNGEMAFLYLGACAVLFLTGGGRYSADASLGAKG